jgi:hypothetical protein
MPRKHTMLFLLGAASVALAFGAGFAAGQAKAPAETKGFSTLALRILDLTEELE